MVTSEYKPYSRSDVIGLPGEEDCEVKNDKLAF